MKNLIILPYAGSTARDMSEFMDYFKEKVNCQIVEYSGHGSRGRELLYETWDDMVNDVAQKLNQMTDSNQEYALLGYSMGSLILYELLAMELLDFKVSCVFFCAHTPKETPRASDHYYQLTDEEFLEKMHQMGGMRKIDKKLLNNAIFKRLYFEPIRNDFRLIGEYASREKKDYKLIDVIAYILYCPYDTPEEQIQKWDKLLKNDAEKLAIGHDHFFIWEKGKEMSDYIISKLEK